MWLLGLLTVVLRYCSASQDVCSLLTADDTLTPWIADNYGRLTFPIYNQEPITASETEFSAYDVEETAKICELNNTSNNVICRGKLNETLIKQVQSPVTNLLVAYYNLVNENSNHTGVIPPAKPISVIKSSSNGKWGDLTSATYKATGDIYSTGVGIGMTLSSNLQPNINQDGFEITGDAFSNELRVGWQIKGEIRISEDNGLYIMKTQLQTEGDGGWSFQGTSYLVNQSAESWSWTINGTVKSDLLLTPISFGGKLEASTQNTHKVSGEVIIKPLLVKWQVGATFTSSNNEYITIPRDVFSGLSIKHIYFKDSYFMGDFDPNAFQGINGLETVTITNSKLEEVPRLDYLFSNLNTVKALYIESSSMPNLLMGNVPTLANMELFSLKGSGPLQINNDSVSWLAESKLTWLNLQDCNINVDTSSINGVLEQIASTLRYLDLSYTSLTRLEALEGILRGLKISHLSLAGLQLTQVPNSALQYVNNTLRYLTLRRNNFKKVPDENLFSLVMEFPIMSNLEELDMAFCSINYIEAGVFDNLPGLKKLILAHNNVDNVQDGWYATKPQLIHIDLSWNGENVERAELNLQPGEGLAYLTELEVVNLSNAVFTYSDVMVKSLSNSIQILSLCNYGLRTKGILENLSLPLLTLLDLSGNPYLEYGNIGIVEFIFSLQKLVKLYARNNRITNAFFNVIHELVEVKDSPVFMESLTELDLNGNNIKTLSASIFVLFPNLQMLDLTANSIAAWQEPLNIPRVTFLKLSDNKIETVTNAMVKDVVNLKQLEIGKNPFVCNCDVYRYANLISSGSVCNGRTTLKIYPPSYRGSFQLRKNKYVKPQARVNAVKRPECLELMDWANGTNYYCYDKENTEDFKVLSEIRNDSALCVETKESPLSKSAEDNFNALYIGIALLLTFGLAAGFIYWKWWKIRLITRAVRDAAILTFMDDDEAEEPQQVKYHAFVSYCEKDRSWVWQQMLPCLEQWKDINVCLHERDFQAGVSIMENITSSMDKSRHLVLVLSKSFVTSQWCQFELQLAQHRKIESKRNKLVLILLEPIPYYKKTRTLKYLMRTNTYLEWPGDGDKIQQDRFWRRLIQSITSNDTI